MRDPRTAGLATRAIHGARSAPLDPAHGAIVPPIHLTSAFVFERASQGADRFAGREEGYIYTRMGNPTVKALEERLALLDGGEAAVTFASGMGAIAGLLLHLVEPGGGVLSVREVYGGTHALFQQHLAPLGYEFATFDPAAPDLEAELDARRTPRTRVLYLETPSNPSLVLADLGACARWARERGITTVVDNTFSTACLVRPLELGIDWVVYSATKYLNGHGDCIAGAAVGPAKGAEALEKAVGWHFGNVLSPFNAWLVLRGLETLPLRMERHCANALTVARFLEGHPKVTRVLYPGLPSHPQHALATRQMRGFGGMVSFLLPSREAGPRLLDGLGLCLLAVSLGHVATLMEHPASMTHAAYSEEECRAAGLDPALVRMSVGLEDPEDLIADLSQALERV